MNLDGNSDPQARISWVELLFNVHRFSMPTVTSFTNKRIYEKLCDKVSPQWWSLLLSCFPNLKKVVLRGHDNERKALRSRIEARDGEFRNYKFRWWR